MKKLCKIKVSSQLLLNNAEGLSKALDDLEKLGVLVNGVIEYDDDDVELSRKICEILDQVRIG